MGRNHHRRNRVKFTREYLEVAAPGAMMMDGFDDCIVGVGYRCGSEPVVAYDMDMIISKMMDRDGMSYEDAVEFFEFNQLGAYVGKQTPIFLNRNPEG